MRGFAGEPRTSERRDTSPGRRQAGRRTGPKEQRPRAQVVVCEAGHMVGQWTRAYYADEAGSPDGRRSRPRGAGGCPDNAPDACRRRRRCAQEGDDDEGFFYSEEEGDSDGDGSWVEDPDGAEEEDDDGDE